MLLRNVVAEDLDAYIRLRCDPRMMADLGGPQDPSEMDGKVRRDASQAAADEAWILMICPDGEDPTSVAGTVTVWSHDDGGAPQTEIGWMVLPEFQGQGLAKRAVAEVLRRASDDGRWGSIHAFPSVTNAVSNRLCESLGFTPVGEQEFPFAGQSLRVQHWLIEPGRESV